MDAILSDVEEVSSQILLVMPSGDVLCSGETSLPQSGAVVAPACENTKLREIICGKMEFGEEVYQRMIDCGMDSESLLLIKEDDINELFPLSMLGTRIKFKQRLANLKETKMDYSSLESSTSSISSNHISKPAASTPVKSLDEILKSTPKGFGILQQYKENSFLQDEHRDALVNIIVNHFSERSTPMTMRDIIHFSEQIILLFPIEDLVRFPKSKNFDTGCVLTQKPGPDVLKFTFYLFIPSKRFTNKQKCAFQNIQLENIGSALSFTDQWYHSFIMLDSNIRTSLQLAWQRLKRYYCNKRGGKNPTGKLYDKAANARRKMKKCLKVTDVELDTNSSQENEQFLDEDAVEKKVWLSHNLEPWSVVEQKWRDTIALRMKDVKNKSLKMLDEWPLLKHSLGYALIEIDFEAKYPSNSQSLFAGWSDFTRNILPYMKEKVKDAASKNFLAKLDTCSNSDSSDCIIILLLHAVLKPSLISMQQASAGKRLKWKPSITDAQNATVMHCQCINDYQRLYEELKSKAMEKSLPLQPVILVIGPDIANLINFYVLFDGILYKVPTFLKALDTIFKLFHVLSFEYPAEAKNLYNFIQSYFFNIECIQTPNIVVLTSYLKNVK